MTTQIQPAEWAYDGRRYRRHKFSTEITSQLKQLNKLDNWHAPTNYSIDILIIAAAIAAPTVITWWLYPISVILIASRQRALSNLLHECAHNTAAKSAKLNLLLGTAFSAYPILQTHYGYKRSHVATHHPKLGDPTRDPDLKYFIEKGVYRAGSKRTIFFRLIILPALGAASVSHTYFLFRDRILKQGSTPIADRDANNEYWISRMRRDRYAFVAFWIIALASITLLGVWFDFLLFWILPYLTIFQIIGWYIELSEHTPMVKTHNVDLYMTRNRMSRGIERFLTGTYADHRHLDHHLDVRTPYWNLARAHSIRMADADYAELHDSFGGLFTKGRNAQPSALSTIVNELAASSKTFGACSRSSSVAEHAP